MTKRDNCLLTLAYLAGAAVFFLIAWLFLRGFCLVTETWEIENPLQQLERESDYRFYQFVPSLGSVQVEVSGGGKPALIRTEKAGYGRVALVEGYELDGDQIQTITLRYRLNPFRMKSKLPSLEPYVQWAEEFHAISFSNITRMDAGLYGKSTMLRATDLEPDLHMSLPAMIGAAAGFLAGIIILVTGVLNFRIRPTRSSEYAKEQLEQLSQTIEEEKRRRLEALAGRYSRRYSIQMGTSELGLLVILFTCMTVVLILGEGSNASMAVFIVLVLAVSAAASGIRMGMFRRFVNILAEECEPYAAVTAFTALFGTRQRFRINRWNYSYHSIIAMGFYYMGEFAAACRHLELVWEETPARLRKMVIQIHYRTLRLYCLRELGRTEEAEAEKEGLEEILRQHPGWERHDYVKSYRDQEKVLSLMDEGKYEEARRLLFTRAEAGQPLYIRAAAHYQLWRNACLAGDRDEAGIHEEFISQYGKDMFYYARINREQQ